MKVLVIPDIHLKPWMFDQADQTIKERKPDRILLLGDIVDDWNHKNDIAGYRNTIERAVLFSKGHPDALWCIGNHDASYLWDQWTNKMAYRAKRTAVEGIKTLYAAIPEGHLAYVHRIDNVLFVHAGLLKRFVDENVSKNSRRMKVDNVIKKINGLGEKEMWDDLSPIWARPQEYLEWGFEDPLWQQDKYLQVVGHTPVQQITLRDNLLSCDVFTRRPDGKKFGSEEFCLVDTNTWEWEGVPTEHEEITGYDGRKRNL